MTCTIATDVVGVAGGDAVVDDVGVEAGQVEGREHGRELEDGHGGHVRQVGPQVAPDQGPEHGSPGAGWCGPADGVGGRGLIGA
jgi:hypothetical protein